VAGEKGVWAEQLEQTVETGEQGQNSWDRTAGTEQLGQDSRDRTAGTGQLVYDSLQRTAGPRQESRDRKAGGNVDGTVQPGQEMETEQPEHGSKDRTAKTQQLGQNNCGS
jgi:hypothetical protein